MGCHTELFQLIFFSLNLRFRGMGSVIHAGEDPLLSKDVRIVLILFSYFLVQLLISSLKLLPFYQIHDTFEQIQPEVIDFNTCIINLVTY